MLMASGTRVTTTLSKYLLWLLFFAVFRCSSAIDTYYYMIGTQGAGARFLLDQYAGRELFEKGAANDEIQARQESPEHWLVAVPIQEGKLEKAAADIKTRIQQPGAHRLIFVVELDEGSVAPQDIDAMKTILDACIGVARLEHGEFAIIVNRLENYEYDLANARESVVKQRLTSQLPRKTSKFLCLEQEQHGVLGEQQSDSLRSFVRESPQTFMVADRQASDMWDWTFPPRFWHLDSAFSVVTGALLAVAVMMCLGRTSSASGRKCFHPDFDDPFFDSALNTNNTCVLL